MNEAKIRVGVVTNMYPAKASCDVQLMGGNTISDVGIMNLSGSPFGTDMNPMPDLRMATVAVLYVYGRWYIIGTLPVNVNPTAQTSPSLTSTGTGTDNRTTYGSIAPTKAQDLTQGRDTTYLPGDKILSATGGATLMLGNDGLAILRASNLAQIILGALKNFCKIICQEFTVMSDFGEFSMSGGGKSGTTGMSIKGGSTFCDESGTHEPIYPCSLYIGTVPGDPIGRFAIHVKDANAGCYVNIDADNAGNISVSTSGNEWKSVEKNSVNTIHGNNVNSITGVRNTTIIGTPPEEEQPDADNEYSIDYEETKVNTTAADITNVLNGNRVVTIESGDQTHTIVGNETLTATENGLRDIGKDEVHNVGRNENHTVGSVMTINAGYLNLNTGGITFNTVNGASNTVKMAPVNIVRA